MTALGIALSCWLATLTLFVALRIRATLHRPAPVRRRMRTAQLRALRTRNGGRRVVVAAGPRR